MAERLKPRGFKEVVRDDRHEWGVCVSAGGDGGICEFKIIFYICVKQKKGILIGSMIGLIVFVLIDFYGFNCDKEFEEEGPGIHFSVERTGIGGGSCQLIASEKYVDYINSKYSGGGRFVKDDGFGNPSGYNRLSDFVKGAITGLVISMVFFSGIGALVGRAIRKKDDLIKKFS